MLPWQQSKSLTTPTPGIQLTSDEKAKHAYFSQKYGPTDGSISEKILDTLTPDDIRVLMKFEDEVKYLGTRVIAQCLLIY